MKKFEVEWSSNQWSEEIRHTIEATDEDHAYRNATSEYRYPEYWKIGVFLVGSDKVREFDNPHYKKAKADAGTDEPSEIKIPTVYYGGESEQRDLLKQIELNTRHTENHARRTHYWARFVGSLFMVSFITAVIAALAKGC